MKTVYKYDNEKKLLIDDIEVIDDDYQLSGNETFDVPESGLYLPIKYIDGKWIRTKFEDYQNDFPNVPAPISDNYLAISKQFSGNLLSFANYKIEDGKIDSNLLLQLAKLKKDTINPEVK